MKLSIIIPVYNSEAFLVKCLESVCMQDLKSDEYEIIVINDGSTDASINIIKDFHQRFPNIIFIDQVNKGVSVARNVGLEYSKGKYITFVDSDDRIEINSLKVILQIIESNNLDILYPKIDTFERDGKRLGSVSFYGNYNEIKHGLFQERRTFPPTFYRKKVLQGIFFNPELSFAEDTVFNSKVQSLAQRVCFVNIPYYKYTTHTHSLSRQAKAGSGFDGLLIAIRDVRDFQIRHYQNDTEASAYFNNVYKIFVSIIIDKFVTQGYHLKRYNKMVKVLQEEDLIDILSSLSKGRRFIDKSYAWYKLFYYQKKVLISLKSAIRI